MKSFQDGGNFKDLLNLVNASTRDVQEVIHLGKEEVFTAEEVVTEIKR